MHIFTRSIMSKMLSANTVLLLWLLKLQLFVIIVCFQIQRTHMNDWSCFLPFSVCLGVAHFLLKTLLWTVLLQSTRPWSNLTIRIRRCLSGPVAPPTCSPSPSESLLISQGRSIVSTAFLNHITVWTGNWFELKGMTCFKCTDIRWQLVFMW